MDVLNRDHLEFLSAAQHRFCVSIFLPTHRAGKEILQDSVRLRHLLKDAEKELASNGIPKTKIRDLLWPARQLERRGGFWRYQSDGLAIFLSSGFFQYFRLPLSFQEFVVVAERFEIEPLLPLFTAGGRHYVLALSQKRVRLLEGTPHAVTEIEIAGIPHSIQDLLKYEVHEGFYQVHSGTGPRAAKGKEASVFHGQGGGVDAAKERLAAYCRQIARGVHPVLRTQTAPLVLACVRELLPMYRQANTYCHLLDDFIEGNPDDLSAGELRGAALDLLRPHFEQARDQALAMYRELASSDRASNDLKQTLRAAHQGRILFVLLPAGVRRWGRYDFKNDEFAGHHERQAGDDDLLNLIAIQTVSHDGALYTIPPGQMPDDSAVAAVFRY